MSGRDDQAGISYGDVSRLAQYISQTWDGRVHIELHLPLSDRSGILFDVRVALWQREPFGNWYDAIGVSGIWPTTEARTMTGLMMRLLWDLDKKLSAAHEGKRSEGQSRLPF